MKANKISTEEVQQLVLSELAVHPECEPVDIYKLLYQALFGPFHLIRDLGQLKLRISSELWQMNRSYEPHYQQIGQIYTRLSLSALYVDTNLSDRDSKIECLAHWVLASAHAYDDNPQDFFGCWSQHQSLLQELIPGDPQTWDELSSAAQRGLIYSHSKRFHEHYDPHYRLVRMDLTEHFNRFMELCQ